ncbi:MAG: response regulator [Thermodesulfovibrionales bacterium]
MLLVEDSPAIQAIYKNALTFEQFQVMTANNGMEAVKVLSQERPDIILLDLMMPVMDGYKVLQVVKTDPKLSKIPVLVFSAKGQPEEVEKALSLGAAGYVVKATTKPKDVIEKIKTIISQTHAGQEVAHYVLGIREDAHDAGKLSDDFKLGNYRCPVCQTTMLLDLIPDFAQETAWFSGKFICPKCTHQKA